MTLMHLLACTLELTRPQKWQRSVLRDKYGGTCSGECAWSCAVLLSPRSLRLAMVRRSVSPGSSCVGPGGSAARRARRHQGIPHIGVERDFDRRATSGIEPAPHRRYCAERQQMIRAGCIDATEPGQNVGVDLVAAEAEIGDDWPGQFGRLGDGKLVSELLVHDFVETTWDRRSQRDRRPEDPLLQTFLRVNDSLVVRRKGIRPPVIATPHVPAE